MTRIASLAALALLFAACQGEPRKGPQEAAKSADASGPAAASKDAGKTPAPAPAAKTRKPVNPRELSASGLMREESLHDLRFSVPGEWERKPGSSPMRLAEFTIPGPGGDAEMVVFRFAGGGGDAASNVHRWRTQFKKADGTPLSDSDGKVEEALRPPLKLTTVDLAGTYVAAVTPGSAEMYNDPDYRMLALIVEGQGDPYFFKAVGSGATMKVWEQGFAGFAASVAPAEAAAPAAPAVPAAPAAPAAPAEPAAKK